MTTINNSNLYYSGNCADVSINVAANTTLEPGTLLGIDKTSGKIRAYDSTNCTADDFYVLLHQVKNTTGSAADVTMCRVLDGGDIKASNLILVDDDDTLTTALIAQLKSSGIRVVKVSEETKGDIL